LVPILRPLIAPNNTITAYASSNTLVVTDYAGNLKRIERIIESIDQPSGTDPVVIPLRSASALDVAQTINKLYADGTQAPGGGGTEANRRVMVVADARSNSLLVQSDNPSALLRVRSLIGMLDSPTSAAGNIHVVFLKNAEAAKIAETLRAIYSGETSSGRPTAQMQALTSLSPIGYPATSASAGTAPRMNAAPQGASPAAATPGIIQADIATNSIIITAPDAIYNNLRAVVEKLDVRRTQVYVEALVAEITAANAAEFGIQWQNLTGGNATTAKAIGGTNFGTTGQNILGVSQSPTTAAQGLNIGVVKGTVTIGGVQILNLGLLVRALESNNSANILSTPTLLTMDNQEATIVVGQNVPFITGQYAVSGAATTPTPFQTIERKDVGLTLRIKPQISEGGTVRLQVYQEVSSIDSSSNPSGLITNKRSLESTVMVDDGQIVVIGGLLQDSVGDGEGKVPLLGDLPVLGSLFRYNTRTRTKTNLMVFLRPTILRTAQGAETITGDRYDFIRGEQSKPGARPSEVLPTYPKPVLPPRDEGAKAAAPVSK
jgi:general secretion pathway protein D